jgi:hypothetical protein
MIVPAVAPDLVEWVADKLDVIYAPSILFFLALAFVAVMLFHYSLEISRLSDQNQKLAQEVGLLRATLDERSPRPRGGPEGSPVVDPSADG